MLLDAEDVKGWIVFVPRLVIWLELAVDGTDDDCVELWLVMAAGLEVSLVVPGVLVDDCIVVIAAEVETELEDEVWPVATEAVGWLVTTDAVDTLEDIEAAVVAEALVVCPGEEALDDIWVTTAAVEAELVDVKALDGWLVTDALDDCIDVCIMETAVDCAWLVPAWVDIEDAVDDCDETLVIGAAAVDDWTVAIDVWDGLLVVCAATVGTEVVAVAGWVVCATVDWLVNVTAGLVRVDVIVEVVAVWLAGWLVCATVDGLDETAAGEVCTGKQYPVKRSYNSMVLLFNGRRAESNLQ